MKNIINRFSCRLVSAMSLCAAVLCAFVFSQGCYTASRMAYSFKPKVPGEIPVDFAFKLRGVQVVDSSYMGFEDKSRPVLSMEDRLKLRFDPTHRDTRDGLDLHVEYQEEVLPTRFIPDAIPMGFPLRYPLLDAVLPSITTRRYNIQARTRILNRQKEILYEKETTLYAKRKTQRGMFVGVIFVTLFPVRGDFEQGAMMARNYRHEAMARMIIQDLRQPVIGKKLEKAYQKQIVDNKARRAAPDYSPPPPRPVDSKTEN